MNSEKLNIMIVEDEVGVREALKEALESTDLVDICAESDQVQDAYVKILDCQPDALYLDIKLKAGDAFQLMEKLNKHPKLFPPVVLMTGYTEFEFAQRAHNDFGHRIVRILQKPFFENFATHFMECYDAILSYKTAEKAKTSSRNDTVVVKVQNSSYRLSLDDIEYVEVGGSGTIIIVTTNNGHLVVNQTLSSFMEKAPEGIMRIHRNNAINTNKISHVNHEDRLVFLKGKDKGLSIGRTYYAGVFNFLMD